MFYNIERRKALKSASEEFHRILDVVCKFKLIELILKQRQY